MNQINLKICSNYWKIENKDSHYKFKGYTAELKSSKIKTKIKSNTFEIFRMVGGGYYHGTTIEGDSLEDIVNQICMFKKYHKMNFPSYNIKLWQGECPMERHKKEGTGLLTKIPRKEVKNKLKKLFEEYYQINKLVLDKNYADAYIYLLKSKMGQTCLMKINDSQIKEFYIELRKINREDAIKMAKTYFPPKFYFELETAYLHNLEGKTYNKKFELRYPEIIFE